MYYVLVQWETNMPKLRVNQVNVRNHGFGKNGGMRFVFADLLYPTSRYGGYTIFTFKLAGAFCFLDRI